MPKHKQVHNVVSCNTPMTLLLFSCFENNFYYVMSYETQEKTQMTFAQQNILFIYYINKMTLGEINYMRQHQPWHQRSCVRKLE